MHQEDAPRDQAPAPGERVIPELEEDESVPPRPEEKIADEFRAEPGSDERE